MKTSLTPITAAPSPDLRVFAGRGGKLIQYHGWNDSVVPPDGSIGYFHALAAFEHLQQLPKAVADRQIEDPDRYVDDGDLLHAKNALRQRALLLPYR